MTEQRELDGTLASAIPGIQHLRERIAELEAALSASAMSLETIHGQAGRDEYLKHMEQVRGYAHSRALSARAALEGLK